MEERELRLNGMGFQITEVREEDWDWINAGLEESFVRSIPNGFDFDANVTREKAIKEARKIRHNLLLRNEIFIMRYGKERAGMLWIAAFPFQYTGEMRGWILQVYVDTKFRGVGLAKAMLSVAEEWTIKNGMERVGLNVGSGNEEAISLYRNMGYAVEAYNMGKKLPATDE